MRGAPARRGVDYQTCQGRAHAEHWLHAKCPVYRARYEDFHKDTMEQLSLLLLWLGYDLSSENLTAAIEASSLDRMRERNPHIGERFFRRGQVGKGVE